MVIISGGQTGADRAALKAAKACGLETGGWMPKGYLAQDGFFPEFKELYNIQEHARSDYPPRTESNVQFSQGTLLFATNWKSPGEKLTLKLLKKHKKPYRQIDVPITMNPEWLADWIKVENIEVLNIAGNSENTSFGIEEVVEEYLYILFRLL